MVFYNLKFAHSVYPYGYMDNAINIMVILKHRHENVL